MYVIVFINQIYNGRPTAAGGRFYMSDQAVNLGAI